MRSLGRKKTVALVGGGIVVVVALVVAVLLVRRDGGGDDRVSADRAGAQAAAEAFADAVTAGRPGQGSTVQPPAEVDAAFLVAVQGLGQVSLTSEVDTVEVDGDAGRAALTTTWTLGDVSWTTPGTLNLIRVPAGEDGTWRASWSLGALDSRLRPGDLLTAEAIVPTRGQILAAGGQVLAGAASTVVVGVEPRRATDVAALAAELATLVDVDAADVAARVEAAAPDAFVEIVTLDEARYARLRDQLRPLPGTVFRREGGTSAVPEDFARPVIGEVGPATEEQVAASDGRIVEGQLTGMGGIQEAFDDTLAGTPGVEITVTRALPPGDGPTTSAPVTTEGPPTGPTEVLETIPAVDGTDVTTTLDIRVQEAAAAALQGQTSIASLVAVRPSTGEILADANVNNGGFDYGSRAKVPPGSTFKVVTTLAHLRKGLTPEQIVPCPATIDVGGREFKNAGGFALGDVPFSLDFARSCNTAFVSLADELAPNDLTDTAAEFGIGVEWTTGIPTYTGSVPNTEGLVDAAASSIGQGRIVVSPLDMVGVASTVASGRWRAPTLVTDPPVAIPAERPLGPGEAETLTALMRGVVTNGSGEVLLGVPGEPVMAKTGTAEFGTEDPPETHAWIIGFQGDLAFAVFVEGGAGGGAVAGPVAAQFLTSLAGPP